MKPFLRLRKPPLQVHYVAAAPMCVCCMTPDEPMTIKWLVRRGIIKAWLQQCVNGVQEWWPYTTEMRLVSTNVRPA